MQGHNNLKSNQFKTLKKDWWTHHEGKHCMPVYAKHLRRD